MIITSKNVWINNSFQHKSIHFEQDRITQITDPVVGGFDYEDRWILPGFIVIHDHGFKGVEANKLDHHGLEAWTRQLAKEGVTSFLPTFLSERDPSIEQGLMLINELLDNHDYKVRVLGIFIEGPFLSEKQKGVFNPESFKAIDIELIRHYQKISGNRIKMITLAPELEGAVDFIQQITQEGIVVSLGHSQATYEQAKAAIDAGARCFTHLYNAMSGLHHRAPGMVGACLDTKNVYAELITDGHHVSDAAVRIAVMAKGEDYLITVTDPTGMKGLVPGAYIRPDIDKVIVVKDDGTARTISGTFAGSMAKMNELLNRNLYYYKLPLVQTIKSATINPAKMLGIDQDFGTIEVGKYADLVICDDQFNVNHVYVGGQIL